MYSLLVLPGVGIMVIRTDGQRSEQIGAVASVELGERVVELLNRHGLVDPDLSVAVTAFDGAVLGDAIDAAMASASRIRWVA